MLKQKPDKSLVEQTKAIFCKHYFSKALETTLKEVEKDVLAIIKEDEKKHEALMAHLQPENRPSPNEKYLHSTGERSSYWKYETWFEELDKHMEVKK